MDYFPRCLTVCWIAIFTFPAIAGANDEESQNTPSEAEIPVELRDSAFESFINLEYARTALKELDPAKITDVALQLAEGERVLGREHASLSSASLIEVAIRTATEDQDRGTLDRLVRYAEQSKNSELVTKVEAATKLASAARKLMRLPTVPVGETTSEGIVLFNAFRDQIRAAAAFRNMDDLMLIQASLGELTELHPKQRQYLAQMIAKVTSSSSRQSSKRALALSKLSGRRRFLAEQGIVKPESADSP